MFLGLRAILQVGIIADLSADCRRFDGRVEEVTSEIEAVAKADAANQRLMTVHGIGPIIASAMVAAIDNGAAFTKGRDFAAWLGLVPRQTSTGDQTILGRISKRGNKYLRTVLIQCTRSLLIRATNWTYLAVAPLANPSNSSNVS